MSEVLDRLFGDLMDTAEADVIERDGKVVLLVRWTMRGIGFGELTIVRATDGTWSADEEAMSAQSIARILRLLVEKP